MPKVRVLVVAASALLAAGCSSGPSAPSPAPASASTSSDAASPSASTGACPAGAYAVSSFEGRGAASSIGQGSGGGITADFTDGTFTIASDGSQAAKVPVGPVSAELRFDGQITGTYTGDPAALRLTTTGATGQASVKSFGITRSRSASEIADQLIGSGVTAQVTCDDAAQTAVVVLPDAQLTLARS